MSDTRHFALSVLLAAAVLLAALLANRVSGRIPVPLPAVFLAGAAGARALLPSLHEPDAQTVERVVTVALLMILLDGGLGIGWTRFRRAAAPIAVVGVAGTFATAAATAALAHWGFQLSWYSAALLATAVSPTDPAVVFSVLGQRLVAGRSRTVIEGESGANDPVGIALMSSLIMAGGVGAAAFANIGAEFALQMILGATLGVAGGRGLVWLLHNATLPSAGLYPLLSLAWALMLYGATTTAHGSGFLAIFVAGIVLGDEKAPYKRDVERFHSALASLAEIVAFILLGLTIDAHTLTRADVWIPGLALGVALAVAIRPAVVSVCLLGSGLAQNERAFVLFAGLKGAVPILLGSFVLKAGVPDGRRLYGIVVIVVVFSVVCQGSLVPAVTRVLGLATREVEATPWAVGVRLRAEPDGVHRLQITSGAPAEGQTLAELVDLPAASWVSFVVRDLQLLTTAADTRLQAGDEVLVLAPDEAAADLAAIFAPPSP